MTLHLTHRYLGCTTMYELNKATALADKDLNIYNLPEALEEQPELMFSHVIRKIADEDSRVVRVGELVCQLYSIKRSRLVVLIWNTPTHMASESLSNSWSHKFSSVLVGTVSC